MPILVDGRLYFTTPFNRVIALDSETGPTVGLTTHWSTRPEITATGSSIAELPPGWIARGPGKPCGRRLFEAKLNARLIALDAATGAPCGEFGEYGQVSLREVPGYAEGWYHMTSPPAVIGNNARVQMPSGVVRAFDARSAARRWSWNLILLDRPKAKTWLTGAGNAWSVMAVDPDRDLVFVPTGSAGPDYYGGLRPGERVIPV